MRVIAPKCRRLFSGPGLCARCQGWFARRDCHHAFIAKGMGGASQIDVDENLAALDRVCHSIVEDHEGAAQLVRLGVVARLGIPGLTIDDVWEWLWAVRRAPKAGPMPGRPWGRTDAQELTARPRVGVAGPVDPPGEGGDPVHGHETLGPPGASGAGVPSDQGGWNYF